MARMHRIAVFPGDGIGKEVVPEGMRVLDAAARTLRHRASSSTHFDWSLRDYYAKHGTMMPADWMDADRAATTRSSSARSAGPSVPDHVSLWGSLIPFRREFRPVREPAAVRLMPGIALAAGRPQAAATSTSTSCARTPRANIPRSAAGCSKAPSASSCRRRACSPAWASTAS